MLNPQVRAIRLIEILLLTSALVLFIVGSILQDTFFLRLATESLIFGGLAMSVDLLLGIVGLLSLGQALYFGFGAYLSALVLKEISPSFFLAIGIVTLSATVLGWIASFVALRSKGVYFALITFGLAQVAAKVVYNTRSLGASDGMMGVPILQIWTPFGAIDTSQPGSFFLITLLTIGGLYAVLKYFLTTPMGSIWHAIRSNEDRLAYVGYKSKGPKQVAFILAAVVAAVSGALYPMLRGFVSPELMFFSVSGNAVVTVVLGGVGTLIGPILGSVLLTAFKSIIGTWTVHHHIVIGIIFVVIVVSAPKGISGLLAKYLSKKHSHKGEE
ncbi:branched-chain amino acid ABC transporter permease [Polynucleobacter sp. IMCC30063]|jgi:branched-chain amino acid transport system permease protein|uniref:branched-chain amino acid ABC transporter permease n=1 Tax=unclassified Polynucleobacter TaxID=2640945 RepID=UPI001F305D15|nr:MULTISPECIES: branched-chain amino acid ABC transporter permease [unclassified Polynucleobacter]MCE7506528.1 branched-chain amino acid ABC transporter permease [Polynucleobacter sp. IMCC30063]MCE7527472.1 branched-chain amino acid ABC transporter permease [Polynucleobacter sp. IMCC 30228]